MDAEARLVADVRAPVGLRRALARVAERMVTTRGWERLGFARLEDYAAERVGVSARELRELARVSRRLEGLPALEAAFLSGALPWTKLRLLCRVATQDDEEPWLERARGLGATALAREVRAVDERARAAAARAAGRKGAAPVGAPGDASEERRAGVVLRCTPEARARWWRARQVASRVAGRTLAPGEVAEAVAAEVLSALPLELGFGDTAEIASETPAVAQRAVGGRSAHAADLPPPPAIDPAAPSPFAAALEDGLEEADAFALDARLRRAVRLEAQGLARVARGLAAVVARGLHRSLGYRSLDVYAEDRLGVSKSRARALLRIERAAERCPALRAAFASGRLSWVGAHTLVPLLLEPGAAPHRAHWIAHAGRVSARRLADDVGAALASGDLAPPPLWGGGDPPIGTSAASEVADAGDPSAPAGLQTGAIARSRRALRAPRPLRADRCRVFFHAPAEVAFLFRAALATVQRRIERAEGRPSCESEAFEAMLAHALATWEAHDPRRRRPPREHRVFERDGWRCTAPGCSSYRNLHAHHVVFRSRQGTDDLANLTTLCAWHHLRGVHAGLVRCRGSAPHHLRFELGLRPDAPPLAVYRVTQAGDVRCQVESM